MADCSCFWVVSIKYRQGQEKRRVIGKNQMQLKNKIIKDDENLIIEKNWWKWAIKERKIFP